ncbi:MAG: hypothetical protein CMD08_02065 [Flavobacteriales bacterium]|nr:hypothetical protein [Flavobacteriales bacterium]
MSISSFTNDVDLHFFDRKSREFREFKAGSKFKVNKIGINYNDYYKTYVYHVRMHEKKSNSYCSFTCSRKENSRDVILYSGKHDDYCLSWDNAFKEKCPL